MLRGQVNGKTKAGRESEKLRGFSLRIVAS